VALTQGIPEASAPDRLGARAAGSADLEPWLAIVNPAAGGGRCGARAPAALEALRSSLADSGRTLTTAATRSSGDAARIARDAFAAGARRFVAVGGDGTAFEVLNGLFPAAASDPRPPVLGFLPLGTGNSFVRDWSRDGVAHGLEALRSGRRRRVDLLRVAHRDGELWALGVVSLAFPAAVAAVVNRRLKPFGKLGYSIGVLIEVARLSPRELRMAIDGGEPHAEAITLWCACNNRHVGGDMKMAPDAAVDDGLLDLVTAGPVGRLELLRTFPRIFAGTHIRHPAVRVRRARVIELELAAAADVMIDGESLRLWVERVEVVPGAITVAL
jgi:diacylglycerol kinase (ATP)